jgi:hypothetical protein
MTSESGFHQRGRDLQPQAHTRLHERAARRAFPSRESRNRYVNGANILPDELGPLDKSHS